MKSKKKTAAGGRSLGLLLLLTNFIFFVLYRRFWFGDATYFYTDIGSDGFSSSYPIIALLGRLVRSGNISAYSLEDGLGTDISTMLMQYINPVKALLLLFPEKNLPTAVMVFLLVETNLTALFAWAYFRLILSHSGAAFFPALAFTFSSYVTLWSQNITFGTGILMFILTMYIYERFFRLGRLRSWLLLVIVIALFAVTNYYFLYMTGIFLVFYIAVRAIAEKNGFLSFLKNELRLAGAALFGALIALFALLPTASAFLGSARTSDVSRSLTDILKMKTSPAGFLTVLGRLLSPNTLGIGDSYTGAVNYYEDALLFTSILAFFAFFYLLFLSRTSRKMTLIAAVLSAAALLLPVSGQILNFNFKAQRFSFMICFLEAIAIGFYMKSLLTERERTALRLSLILTPASVMLIIAALLAFSGKYGIRLESRSIKLTASFTLLYEIVFGILFVAGSRRRTAKKERHIRFLPRKELLPPVILAALSAELIVVGGDTLYKRPYITKAAFSSSYFHSGNKEAAAAIQTLDTDLYRITPFTDTTSQIGLANDSLVNGYNGMSIYYNSNPQSLITLADFFGVWQNQPSYFCTATDAYDMYTLLGGRYLMRDEALSPQETPDTALFERMTIENTSGKTIYRNRNALPFGYFYTNEYKWEDLAGLPAHIRGRALSRGFVYTNSGEDTAFPEASLDGIFEETSFSADNMTGLNDVALEATDGKSFTALPEGDDPFFLIPVEKSENAAEADVLHIRLGDDSFAEGDTTVQVFFLTDAVPAPDINYSATFVFNTRFPETDITLPEGVTGLRIDIENNLPVTFDSISLLREGTSGNDYDALLATDISDISFSDSTYRATLNADADGMLCVPLLWSENWQASVDGDMAPVQNINGGLCGIAVTAGTHSIRLTYRVPHFGPGIAVSLIAAAAWCFLMGHSYRPKRRV